MNLVQSLLALSGYPIPYPLVYNALEGEGLTPEEDATPEYRNKAEYKRCKAAVYDFLSTAPNVSQGGISYSFSDADKARFKKMANDILSELDKGVEYGYIGDSF